MVLFNLYLLLGKKKKNEMQPKTTEPHCIHWIKKKKLGSLSHNHEVRIPEDP